MDLTKVTLPTFILERRSLLEMYADFFTHPDAFVSTSELESPEKRFVYVFILRDDCCKKEFSSYFHLCINCCGLLKSM